MPHNLYLHSALVQSRAYDTSPEGKRQACRFNLVDSAVALNVAFFVNAAILVVSAAAFHGKGTEVTELQQAHSLLSPMLGTTLAGVPVRNRSHLQWPSLYHNRYSGRPNCYGRVPAFQNPPILAEISYTASGNCADRLDGPLCR